MATKKKNKKKSKPNHAPVTPETRASEAITVAWTVTVTTVLLCNLVIIASHFYIVNNPDAKKMELLRGMMLLGGSLVGIMSLLILPVLYRVRSVAPPRGVVVFGICAAIAPILAVLAQTFL